MNKEEYIVRYGAQKWEQHLKDVGDINRRRKMGLPPAPKKGSRYWKDNVTEKIWLPIPDMEYTEQLVENERRAVELQKQMRKEWFKETGKNFILTVTYGAVYKERVGYLVDLCQLNMDRDMQKKFKEFCGRSWDYSKSCPYPQD